MNNFDLKKYLAEGKLTEDIPVEEMESFAEGRGEGAETIADNAKEKGGNSMLTYHHFKVKSPYYKKAKDGNFNEDEFTEDYKGFLEELYEKTKDGMNIEPVAFQELMGKIEVLGELLVENKEPLNEAEEEDSNKVPGAALILPRGKEVILQAEEEDYKRGLLVTLEESGGYKIKYWYGDDVKVYPAEVEVDGESIKKDAIEVDILFHPELKENVAPNHDGKSSPYGSGYKKLNKAIDESLHDWFKKEDWVRINTSGNISGKCGTMKKGKAITRCLPKKKAQSLTKAERKATVAKKVRGSKKGKQFVKNTNKAKFKKKK